MPLQQKRNVILYFQSLKSNGQVWPQFLIAETSQIKKVLGHAMKIWAASDESLAEKLTFGDSKSDL